MADDGLGEHASLSAKVPISICEADGSQGTSRSSLVSSTSSSSESDGSQAVSRCTKSGVEQDSSNLSWLGMEVEGASSVLSILAVLTPKASSTFFELVDCNVDARSSKTCGNKAHKRSKVESPSTKEPAPTLELSSEGGSNAASAMEESAPSSELTTNIVNLQGGGSNAVSTMEELAPTGELTTYIVNLQGGGSNAAPNMEESALYVELTTNI
eukprot:13261376-Ditylum_brightwellii.AAC.1